MCRRGDETEEAGRPRAGLNPLSSGSRASALKTFGPRVRGAGGRAPRGSERAARVGPRPDTSDPCSSQGGRPEGPSLPASPAGRPLDPGEAQGLQGDLGVQGLWDPVRR